ncbi:hypothetical protein [Actinophytocola sp.]|nr:hypothetical protein [Actinophytocola sp.]
MRPQRRANQRQVGAPVQVRRAADGKCEREVRPVQLRVTRPLA